MRCYIVKGGGSMRLFLLLALLSCAQTRTKVNTEISDKCHGNHKSKLEAHPQGKDEK